MPKNNDPQRAEFPDEEPTQPILVLTDEEIAWSEVMRARQRPTVDIRGKAVRQ
jgi:hypothetical protein